MHLHVRIVRVCNPSTLLVGSLLLEMVRRQAKQTKVLVLVLLARDDKMVLVVHVLKVARGEVFRGMSNPLAVSPRWLSLRQSAKPLADQRRLPLKSDGPLTSTSCSLPLGLLCGP